MRIFLRAVLLSVLVLFLFSTTVPTAPISEEQAKNVAQNWLSTRTNPMQGNIGRYVKSVTPFKEALNGSAGYYFVQLDPNGWVVVPADDSRGPI